MKVLSHYDTNLTAFKEWHRFFSRLSGSGGPRQITDPIGSPSDNCVIRFSAIMTYIAVTVCGVKLIEFSPVYT